MNQAIARQICTKLPALEPKRADVLALCEKQTGKVLADAVASIVVGAVELLRQEEEGASW
jgi:hypothetical protein